MGANSKRIHHVMVMILILGFFACKKKDTGSRLSSSPFDYQEISIHCFAPQGNGGNWASTLGWLSEAVKMRVETAIQRQAKTGKKIGLDFSCMTGGSSGSAATVVVMQLLANQNLFPNAISNHNLFEKHNYKGILLNTEQGLLLADAIQLMGLTADLNFSEMLNFYRQVVGQNFKSKLLDLLYTRKMKLKGASQS